MTLKDIDLTKVKKEIEALGIDATPVSNNPNYDKWKKFIHRVHELCNVSKTVTPTELAKVINRSRQAAHAWKRKAAKMVERGQLYPNYQKSTFPKDLESFLEY